jgi:hypothetical protein
MATALSSDGSAADYPLRKAKELSARGGLPNFFSKLEKNKSVKIAYLGGSITAQEGWRVHSLSYLQKTFPQTEFSGINAGIGGTGSTLGAFRVDHDVLRNKPDLMFIEFAVNDVKQKPEDIIKSMEGIIRQTWKQLPACDICFVYTLTDYLLPDIQLGKFPQAASVMEQIADYYGIPSIHMGLEVARLEKLGKLQMKAPDAAIMQVSGDELDVDAPIRVADDGRIPFSADGIHPYCDTGHILYTEAIIRSLPVIKETAAKPEPHFLPSPIDDANLSNAVMLPVEQADMTGPWHKLIHGSMAEKFEKRVPSLWEAGTNAELSFRFKGSRVMIYDIKGPDCGKLEVTIDDMTFSSARMDGFCSYHRLNTLEIAKDLNPQKIHKVNIKLLADKLDKAEILFEYKRDDFKTNPEKYASHNWYVGAILLVGELISRNKNDIV